MAENRILRICCTIIILFLSGFFLHAEGEVGYFIANADDETILNMASVRGLDTTQSVSSLRNILLEGESVFDSKSVEETEGYSLEIINADSMDVTRDGLITLSGNVQVVFSLDDEGDDKTLYAGHMLLDSRNGRLTAYGNVRYEDSGEDSGLENIAADIVTYLYDSGDLLVSGGMTSSQRTNNEDEKVTFYTSGDLLNYRSGEGGLFFQDGYLTSNPDTAYSSITAENIALLEGGDMFLTNAYLSIGRVPIIYLPAFFFPGSRLAINPAFGFNSERGMFVSTTTEIFGRYPNFSDAEESSFASLLRTESDEDMVSNGLYYVEGEAEGRINKWAAESESYLALLADVYQHTGFLIGYDSQLNFFEDALSAASETSFILSPAENHGHRFRYYSINTVNVSSSFADLRLSLPVYSDPSVLKKYSNRLTSFSIDSILGGTQKFPATRTSTVSNYEARLSGSVRLPSDLTNDYIKTLRISNISADADFSWSDTRHRYEISDITLPSFNFTMSGKLFDFSTDGRNPDDERSREKFDLSDQFILENPLLYDMYILEREEKRSMLSSGSYLRLSYNLSERFSNEFEYDLDKRQTEDNEIDSSASFALTFEGGLSRIVSFTQRFTPSYGYSFDESDDELHEHDFSLLSASSVSLPFIGITYDFSAYLYRFSLESDIEGRREEEILYAFDKENVRTHRLRFSKSFGSQDNYGVITPSLSYTLPPLSAVLTPSVSYRYDALSAAFSWKFEEEETGKLASDDIDFSLSLSYTHFTFSYSMNYESALFDSSDPVSPLSLKASASVRSEDKKWSLTQSFDFDFENNGERNIVNSLRTSLSIPYVDIIYNMKTHEGRLQGDYIEIRSDTDELELYAWKNRIYLCALLDARLRYDFINAYSSSLSVTAGVEFSIAEFLSLRLSFTTTNNGFYRYIDKGRFSFAAMMEDLLKSFDFIGDGRRNTQFNLQSFDIELVHYMDDWDLHLRYTAQLEETGDNTYGWVPAFAIYLRWATMPDLKVDETYHQTSSGWQKTGSLYSED